jgi:hypothetical protein
MGSSTVNPVIYGWPRLCIALENRDDEAVIMITIFRFSISFGWDKKIISI